jgi:arabinofuranosyltransferase
MGWARTWLRKPVFGWALLFWTTVLLLLGRAVHLDRPYALFDDAFISFRYAVNLSEGSGLVFNPGERVEGYTNFLWTVLLAVFHRLGADITVAAQFLALLYAVGSIALLFLFGRRTFWDGKRGMLLAAMPALLFAAMGSQARYVLSGMETLQFTFLVTLSAYLFLFSDRTLLVGVAFALSAMTRPEGLMYFALALGTWLVAPQWAGRERPSMKDVLWFVAAFLLLYGGYYVWRYSYYGYPLPNTFYAKASALNWLRLERGSQILWQMLSRWSLWPILAMSAIGLLPVRKDGPWLFLAAMVVVTCLYFVLVGGDFIVWFGPRFLMPVLPLLLLLCAEGLRQISAFGLVPRRGRYVVQILLLVCLLVNALWFSWPTHYYAKRVFLSLFREEGPITVEHPLGEFSVQMEGWAEMGRWIAENSLPEATIAVDAAGLIPFYSRRYALDMFGLNDLHIAHLPMPVSEQSVVAHEKFDPSYILGREPDYIFTSFLDEQGNALSAGLPSVGQEFTEQYELVAIVKTRNGPPSDGRWIITTGTYSSELYEQGYRAGLFQRKGPSS